MNCNATRSRTFTTNVAREKVFPPRNLPLQANTVFQDCSNSPNPHESESPSR